MAIAMNERLVRGFTALDSPCSVRRRDPMWQLVCCNNVAAVIGLRFWIGVSFKCCCPRFVREGLWLWGFAFCAKECVPKRERMLEIRVGQDRSSFMVLDYVVVVSQVS